MCERLNEIFRKNIKHIQKKTFCKKDIYIPFGKRACFIRQRMLVKPTANS